MFFDGVVEVGGSFDGLVGVMDGAEAVRLKDGRVDR